MLPDTTPRGLRVCFRAAQIRGGGVCPTLAYEGRVQGNVARVTCDIRPAIGIVAVNLAVNVMIPHKAREEPCSLHAAIAVAA